MTKKKSRKRKFVTEESKSCKKARHETEKEESDRMEKELKKKTAKN